MAERNRPAEAADAQALELQRLKRRLELLDQRLDNIDSMVTAVAERVLAQLITINITCPHCNKEVEIAIVGSRKAKR